MTSAEGKVKREHPPLLGVWLVQVLISEELVDDLLGDLEEIFQDRVKQKGRFIARAHYLKDALLSARNADLRRKRKAIQNNSGAMLKNYIKTTFRTLQKNQVYSALNILGLSLGLAACLFIVQYVTYEYSYDKFHSDHENIYRVKYQVYRGESLEIDCAAAVPRVGPFMKENMPEVEAFARAFPMEVVFESDNRQYREKRVQVVDPAFLQIFDYPLIHGDESTALEGPNRLVITEAIAKKYFGRTDVVGESLHFLTWFNTPMEISGVTAVTPENSHLKYNFLVSYETLNQATTDEEDGRIYSETSWGWYDYNTYVQLRDGTDPLEFDQKFAEVLATERQEDWDDSQSYEAFPLQPITDIHLYSNLLQESEPAEQGDGDTVFFLSMIAIFILVIAWINYINLSTAKSMERAKEVGVRKSMGAYKKQLMYQFLTESFVLNFLALSIALFIVFLATPFFGQLVDSPISRSFLMQFDFWAATIGVFIFGSLLSGLYPAFILSSFKPIEVLKGKMTSNSSGIVLRRLLVVFQFTASVTLIAGTLIVYQQIDHMKTLDLGFEMTDTMVIRGPHAGDSTFIHKLRSFKEELNNQSYVKQTTVGSNIPGEEIFWTRGIRKKGEARDKSFICYMAGVDNMYFETFDIELLAGEQYDKSKTYDTTNIILNLATANNLGFVTAEEAIGEKVTIGRNDHTIIGVIANYNQQSLKNNINPLVFPLNDHQSDFITVKLNTSDYRQAYDEVKESFLNFFPSAEFDTFFLDEFYNRQYANERNFSQTFTLFALFAIIVACLGLFGLTSFTAMQKTKEIGIRKVLGAEVSQIIAILSKEFIILVAIANIISWPLVYLIMNGWLDNFTSRISIGITVFFVSAFLVFLIAIVSVGYKTLVTARTNPIKALRYE